MKKIIILVAFILLANIFTSCNQSNATSKINVTNLKIAKERDAKISKGAAVLTFDKSEYNFGTVNEGDIVETVFQVTNSGKTDLIIIDAQVTCGCTVPVWPKTPIKPGETENIKVKFNTNGKPNNQTKNITLVTNSAVGREVLKLRGMVIPKTK